VDERARHLGDRVLEVRARLARTVSVGISGVDCAGKSTLAAFLHEELDSRGVPSLVIAGDEFTRPTADRYRESDEGLGYYRDSFHYEELYSRILPAVRSNATVELTVKVADWERDGWRDEHLLLPAGAVVIAEGCFLFTQGHAADFDLSVWIDLPFDEVVPRALRRPRDLERMGGPDGVRDRYTSRYLPGQAIHLERDAPAEHATLVVR
jgi:uridine kinase